MTTTIGRCSFDNAPSYQSWDGDALSLGINILPSTLAEAKAMRLQMLGLMNNPDESTFPVTCSADPDLDGFYTVTAVNVEPVDAYLTNRLMRCSVGLVRIANGYQNPIIETYVVSRLATNSHGVTSTSDYAIAGAFRHPGEANLVNFSGLTLGNTEQPESVDGADINIVQFDDTNVAGTWTRFGNPSTHYLSPSATIEYQVDSTWYELTGRHIPNGVPWRISNGLIRIGVSSWATTSGLTVEVADTSAWVTTASVDGYDGGSATSYDLAGIAGPFVIRNSPEYCTVKMQGTSGTFVTISVWRGGVIALITMDGGTTFTKPGLEVIGGLASTNVTGGIRGTSTNADGNRLVILCRAAVTTDTTNGRVYPTTATSASVMSVGTNFGATTSTLWGEVAQLNHLCTPPQWRQRVAAR